MHALRAARRATRPRSSARRPTAATPAPCASSAGVSRPRACSSAAVPGSCTSGAHDLRRSPLVERRQPVRSSRRGGAGSSTTPPPTVVSVRSTTWSPRAATTRLLQAKLRVLAVAHDARRHGLRPDVDGHRGGDLLERLEPDVEPVRDRVVARLDEHVAAREVAALDRGQVHGDALPRLGRLDRRVVHLHRPHAHRRAARLDAQQVARGDRARPERAGGDRADALQREDTVDVEARRAASASRVGRARARAPRAARRARRPSSPRRRRPRRRERARAPRRAPARASPSSTASDFVTATTPALDAEQPQHGEMLERLRSSAFLRVDHEQEEVDAGRARDHRAHEPLVARHVDEREPPAVRQLERRVAEVDRDPARLLLGQAIRVLAGERAHEPRLAVVDVAGRADRQRHAANRGGDLVDLAVGERAAVEQQAAVADDPDHRRLVQAERLRRAPPRPRRRTTAAPPAAARRRRRGRPSPRPRRRRRPRAAPPARERPRRPRAACAAPGSRAVRAPAPGRGAASLRARRGRACRCAARGAAGAAAAARPARRGRRRSRPAGRRAACRR